MTGGHGRLDLGHAGLGVLASPLRRWAATLGDVLGGARARVAGFRACREPLPHTGRAFHCQFPAPQGEGVLTVQGPVLRALLERVLTGEPLRGGDLEGRLTDLEAHLVEPLLEAWLGHLADSEVAVVPLASPARPGSWLQIEIELEVDGHGGEARLWLVEEGARRLAPARPASRSGLASRPWLLKHAVHLEPVVGNAVLTLEELQDLRPGDLVPLEARPGDPWRLDCGGHTLARCVPARSSRGLCLIITETEEEPT